MALLLTVGFCVDDVKLFGPVHEYVAPVIADAVSDNALPAHTGPLLPAVGAEGIEFTVICCDLLLVHPFTSVIVTVYVVVVAGDIIIACVVALPELHKYEVAEDDVNVTDAPEQVIPSLLVVPDVSAIEMVGAAGTAFTVKLEALVAVPEGVVTAIVPVVAPAGRVADIVVEFVTEKLAVVPLNFTPVAPVKFVPVIVTVAPEPLQALVGVKLVMVGVLAVPVTPTLSKKTSLAQGFDPQLLVRTN